MNEEFHTHLKKAGEEISLTHEERERMRGVLRAYMEMKPVRQSASRSYAGTFSWILSPRFVAAALVVVLFASSAGVSYAAEGALPGDFLYPIKTDVNEPVQGALAVSTSAKEAWAMSVAAERMQEAATLAAEGRLSTTTQQELQANFQAHAQIAAQNIQQEASSSPEASDATAVQFEAQLSEYQNVLSQIATVNNINVAPLTSAIQTQHNRVEALRASLESRVASTSSDESFAAARLQIAAQEELNASANLAQSDSGSLSSSSAQLVSIQLQGASTTISAGETFIDKNETPDALGAFQSALTATEELGTFLQTTSVIHAHTGLVVGQPQSGQYPKKTQSGSRGNRGGGYPGNQIQPSSTTTATSTASSSLSDTSQVSATNSNETATNTSIQSSFQEEGSASTNVGSTPNVPPVLTLPLSPPAAISL